MEDYQKGLMVGELSLLAHTLSDVANKPLATFCSLSKPQKQLISLAERALGCLILQVEGALEPISQEATDQLHNLLSDLSVLTPESIREHERIDRQYAAMFDSLSD